MNKETSKKKQVLKSQTEVKLLKISLTIKSCANCSTFGPRAVKSKKFELFSSSEFVKGFLQGNTNTDLKRPNRGARKYQELRCILFLCSTVQIKLTFYSMFVPLF